MIISQVNKEQGNRIYTFIKYKDMDSYGISKDSDTWVEFMDRTHSKYLSFHLELIK